MSDLSDDYLKKKFQAAFRDYQSEPDPTSWNKIVNTLPATHHKPVGSLIIKRLFIYICLFTIVVFISKQEGSKVIVPNNDSSQMGGVATQEVLTNQLSEIVQKNKSRCSESEQKGFVLSKPSSDTSFADDEYKDVQEPLPNLNLQSKQNNYSPTRISKSYSDLLKYGKIDSLIIKDLEIVSSGSFDSAQITSEETAKLDKGQRGWILKISPFYNTCVFSPNRSDNEQLKNFQQSSNVIGNRLGIALEIGYAQPVLQKLTLEYSLGVRIISKQFNYQVTSIDNERAINTSSFEVSGITSSINLMLSARTEWVSPQWPIILSLSYDRMLNSNSVTTLMGDQIIYHGIGFERAFNSRFVVRPMVNWGVSLSGNSAITISPVNWGFEAVVKF